MTIDNKTYRISVKGIKGNILTFTGVLSFTSENGLLTFVDQKTGIQKSFALENTEIEEEVPR